MESIVTLRRIALAAAGVAAGLVLIVLAVQAGAYDADANAYVEAMGGSAEPLPVLHGWPWFLVLITGVGLLVASALHAYPSHATKGE